MEGKHISQCLYLFYSIPEVRESFRGQASKSSSEFHRLGNDILRMTSHNVPDCHQLHTSNCPEKGKRCTRLRKRKKKKEPNVHGDTAGRGHHLGIKRIRFSWHNLLKAHNSRRSSKDWVLAIVRLSGMATFPLDSSWEKPDPASMGPGLEAIAPVGTSGRTWMLSMPSISSRTPSCNMW